MANHFHELVIHIIRGRWLTVFAAILVLSVSGATYVFGIYAKAVKNSMGYNQKNLNVLAFFKSLGTNFSIHSGLIIQIMPPWVSLAIGSAMNFFGFIMTWLAVTHKIPQPSIIFMSLYTFIAANSATFTTKSVVVATVKNYPESRGIVIGLLYGYTGLSSAIITQIYHAVHGNDNKSLILLISWLPSSIYILSLFIIRIFRERAHTNAKVIRYTFYIATVLAVVLTVIIILQNWIKFSQGGYIACAAFVIILVFLPLVLFVREEMKLREQDAGVSVDETIQPVSNSVSNSIESSPGKGKLMCSCVRDIFRSPNRGEDYTVMQALFTIDMLIIFVMSICGIGSTLAAIDNMGQIGESLGYPAHSVSMFVSLISIWNFAGRTITGFGSEILLAKYRLPRPAFLTFILLLACVGHILIALGVPHSLYVASVIIGFSFGAQLPLLNTVISELFGLKYYPTLSSFGVFASPIGSYIINVIVVGHFYDAEVAKQKNHSGEERLTCIGVACFKFPFIIIAVVTFLGSLVSLVLVIRTKNFYKSDIYARFQDARSVHREVIDD